MTNDKPGAEPQDGAKPKIRWKLRASVYGSLLLGLTSLVVFATCMPGKSARGVGPSPDGAQTEEHLRATVEHLVEIGPRNLLHKRAYVESQEWLSAQLEAALGFPPNEELVAAAQGDAYNLVAEVGPTDQGSVFVVGAHYDTAFDTPGGNDNGSGVAVTLELARRFRSQPPEGRLRFVLFANEEPPHFWEDTMGSLVHARGCKEREEDVSGMISLETLGYYTDKKGTQNYPPPMGMLYPDTGNFVAFVSNLKSRGLMTRGLETFRDSVQFPSEGAALPGGMPGVGWSDHWSFWQVGYPALMITDTAPFRDAHYHQETDRSDHIDFKRLAIVTDGVEAVIRRLVAE